MCYFIRLGIDEQLFFNLLPRYLRDPVGPVGLHIITTWHFQTFIKGIFLFRVLMTNVHTVLVAFWLYCAI